LNVFAADNSLSYFFEKEYRMTIEERLWRAAEISEEILDWMVGHG
jgi:hypothetical protein